MRCYSELVRIDDFEERYQYLRTFSGVGIATFGFERWLNQAFYHSREWRRVRQEVIARDLGCDLAFRGREVYGRPIIHHMNPIDVRQVRHADINILDPEYLVTCSLRTHNAIHYGDATLLQAEMAERRPGDTKLW
jgi:hypothetical protein